MEIAGIPIGRGFGHRIPWVVRTTSTCSLAIHLTTIQVFLKPKVSGEEPIIGPAAASATAVFATSQRSLLTEAHHWASILH